MRKTLTLLAACLMTGCAGHPINDALTGTEKLAQQDDAYCRSIGARGPSYTTCRLSMTQQRNNRLTEWRNGVADGLESAGRSFDRAAERNTPTTCTTTGPYQARQTSCY